MNPQIAILKEGIAKVKPAQQSFAASLVAQYEAKKTLSEKQWFWVQKLAEEVECYGVPDFTKELEPTGPGQHLKVVEFFKLASKKLKWPSIVISAGQNGQELRIAYMSSGKHVGTVRVSNTESYPYTTIYGYVQSNGHYNSTGKASEELSDRIRRFLTQFGENPQKVSKDYGHFTGKCCFCNTKLTDDTSTAMGYGPTCAKNYGLPYSKAAAQKSVLKAYECN